MSRQSGLFLESEAAAHTQPALTRYSLEPDILILGCSLVPLFSSFVGLQVPLETPLRKTTHVYPRLLGNLEYRTLVQDDFDRKP